LDGLLIAGAAPRGKDLELALHSVSVVKPRDTRFTVEPSRSPAMAEAHKSSALKTVIRSARIDDHWHEPGNWGDFCHPSNDDDFECS
jgi:hypothetical protein